MQRFFLFSVPNLTFIKSDLNIGYSKNRSNIGTLAQMVTNAIFLSHSFRENISVRIFVNDNPSHLFQFKSESMKYLGPEERSFASLILKAENTLKEKFPFFSNNKTWHEINPGFFMMVSNNPFEHIEHDIIKPLAIVTLSFFDEKGQLTINNTRQLFEKCEEILFTICKNSETILFPIELAKDKSLNNQILVTYEPFIPHEIFSLTLPFPLNSPKIVHLLNIMLDKIKI